MWAGLLLLCGGLVLSCSRCQEDKPKPRQQDAAVSTAKPFAELFDLLGLVEWRRGAEGAWGNASNDQEMAVDDSVRTGDKSRVGIRFADGRSLVLESNSELALSAASGGFALLLGRGEVEVTAGASTAGFRLIFGDSAEYVVISDGQARLSRGENGVRIQMIMGRASIGGGDEERSLSKGDSFQLTFGQAEILDAKDLETSLVDRSRSSRLKEAEGKRFVRIRRKKSVLAPASQIRVGKVSVWLRDELGGALKLSKRSQATYLGARQSPKGREGKIELNRGQVRIQLQRGTLAASSEEISTPQAEIRAKALGLTADAQVVSGRKGTMVQVHAGAADVQVGDERYVVKAGQQMAVSRKGKTHGPRSMGNASIWAKQGLRTRVFYDRRPRRLGFVFPEVEEGDDARLELATSRNFAKPILSEPVTGRRFVYGQLKSRKYFWRIRRGQEAGRVGLLELARDPTLGMKRSGALTNVVRDTGIQTKIYFQGSVPALTFRWEQVEGAAKYQVRIYSEDDLEKALVDKTVTGTRFKLKAGKLGEGTYYWFQAARSADGEELHSSQMNKLLLEFQNAAPLLRIDMASSVKVAGMAAKGARLEVNGKAVRLDKNGRFSSERKLKKGSRAVFQLRKPGAGDVYFLRRVR